MPSTVPNIIAKSTTGQHLSSLSPGRANVADAERVLSTAAGGLLAGYGAGCTGLTRLLLTGTGAALAFRGVSGWCAAYSVLGLNTADDPGAPATAVPAGKGAKVDESITVGRPPAEVFAFWRKLSNLPRVMSHLKEVRETDGTRSHWVAKGPLGVTVEWDAEVFNERPGELIAWRSLPGSDVDTAGSVHFAPDGNGGTRLTVVLKYDTPAGSIGRAVAGLFGSDVAEEVRADLARFRDVMTPGRNG